MPLGGGEPGKPCVEIRLEIVDVLKTHMETQGRAFYLPLGRSPVSAGIEGEDEAFIAAPGLSHTEEIEPVEHRGQGVMRSRLQHDGEEAGRAGEVPLPERMTGMVGPGRVDHF